MPKHLLGQTLKLQIAKVTVNIRPRSIQSNELFSVSKQCIHASFVQKTPLVQKAELRIG